MHQLLTLLTLTLLLTACSVDDDDRPTPSTCGPAITVGGEPSIADSRPFTLVDATVTDLCLEVTIGASGCSTTNWQLELFTNGGIAESSPTLTSAALLFFDGGGEVTCQAYFTETYSFDLSPYLVPGSLPTILTLTGQDTAFFIQ
jgi:hypothetical protein